MNENAFSTPIQGSKYTLLLAHIDVIHLSSDHTNRANGVYLLHNFIAKKCPVQVLKA